MANLKTESQIEEQFIRELRHHLLGWNSKILEDFSEKNYANEMLQLQNDPVYSKFGLAIPEYILIRIMGRLSISIGRRLGEIYDKVPRLLTSARFNLSHQQIALTLNELQLDIGIPINLLSAEDKKHLLTIFRTNFPNSEIVNGLGIEIRYNFNPNDSSRLRKDESMAASVINAGLFPIYLIFSEMSPRDEAIARLKRSGWNFLVGQNAENFMNKLIGMNFSAILDRPRIKHEIRQSIDEIMENMRNSIVFRRGAKID